MRIEIPLSNQAVPYITVRGARISKAARRLVICVGVKRHGRGSMLMFSATLVDDR